jgi:hypothetical protein
MRMVGGRTGAGGATLRASAIVGRVIHEQNRGIGPQSLKR